MLLYTANMLKCYILSIWSDKLYINKHCSYMRFEVKVQILCLRVSLKYFFVFCYSWLPYFVWRSRVKAARCPLQWNWSNTFHVPICKHFGAYWHIYIILNRHTNMSILACLYVRFSANFLFCIFYNYATRSKIFQWIMMYFLLSIE